MKKILPIVVYLLLPLAIRAQQLIVEIPDTALRNHVLMFAMTGMDNLHFDSKGVAVYNDTTLTGDNRSMAVLSVIDKTYNVVMEQGKTQRLHIDLKKGRQVARYKGANADFAECANAYGQWYPEKDYARDEATGVKDTISFDEAMARLKRGYEKLTAMASKLSREEDRRDNLLDFKLTYLAYRLQLLGGRDEHLGIAPRKDAKYIELIGQIDPNDTTFLSHGLIDTYIAAYFPIAVSQDMKVEDYGKAYVETVEQHVQNKKIKDILYDNIARNLLGSDKEWDFNGFWNFFKTKADTAIVNEYQFIVDSKNRNKKGAKCPDITFTDVNGQQHHLSEFFGKVIYLDLWATWCGPCVLEIPYLEQKVEKYKDNDKVVFISISLDRNERAWKEKIAKNQPQWPQFHANRDEDRFISEQFGVMSIPRFIIINADGTINNSDAFRPSDEHFDEKLTDIINR